MHASTTEKLRQAFTASYSQQNRLLRIHTPLGPDAFVVERLSGREAVNELFTFSVDCVAPNAFYQLETLVGMPATITLLQADGTLRPWHAHILSASFLGSDGGLARYRLQLEPWLAFLAYRRNSLIFQDCTALDIIDRLLADYDQADYSLDLNRELPVRSRCTQYRESDLDFLRRLLAEEGLNYRFVHPPLDPPVSELAPERYSCRLHVFDPHAETPELAQKVIRFHRIAAPEIDDAINQFSPAQAITPSQIRLASWRPELARAHSAEAVQSDPVPALPPLELYLSQHSGPRTSEQSVLEEDAERRLACHALSSEQASGAGSTRRMEAGAVFSLQQHATADGDYLTLTVEHQAANNLGQHLSSLLGQPELDHGSYRNRFLAVPARAALAPKPLEKPRPGGPETALVVGLQDHSLTSNRDHRVKIQFPWQRGLKPVRGGLEQSGSSARPDGNAPGNVDSGTWVRLAEPQAGPNWGSVFVPRVGSEVLVDYRDDDIDCPIIIGRLHNGQDTPPFATGQRGGANHSGVLSGIQTRTADSPTAPHEAQINQWIVDDSPGQLRHEISTSQTDARLGLGHLIDQQGAQRGKYRGEGFELSSKAWTAVRAGEGFLVSTTARPQGRSAAMDPQEAVAQLIAAEQLAESLSEVAEAQGASALKASQSQRAFIRSINPEQDGRHEETIGGQDTRKHQNGTRHPGDAAERFALPHILFDSASSLLQTTPASSLNYTAGDMHSTVQGEAQHSAGATHSSVAGGGASLFTHSGGINSTAANGSVSIQAHDDALEILADDSVSVSSSSAGIKILARDRIVLTSGQSSVTLEGGNITFACPGTFTVRGAMHEFTGPACEPAVPPSLPTGNTRLPDRN